MTDKASIKAVQAALTQVGLLDPPADGVWGPVSQWALDEFCLRASLRRLEPLDPALKAALDAGAESSPFPLRPGTNLAGHIVAAMLKAGCFVCRHPDCINIVYIEGADPDGTPNGNTPNQFNDARTVVRVDGKGVPVLAGSWEATTEPGQIYTTVRPNPGGAARIALGQQKAWTVGLHHGTDALVQRLPITVYRDRNEDFSRKGDPVDHGLFGINQHAGYNYPRDDIRDASAGCLVGRLAVGHAAFMALVHSDQRYRMGNGYVFMTTVLEVAALA